MTNLIHPKLLENLHNFYPSLCRIEVATETSDDYYDEVKSWAPKYVDIPCSIATSGGQEVKRPDMTFVPATHRISLAYHPGITEKMRAVVNGLTLDILLVEHDSHQITTRLSCEVVR